MTGAELFIRSLEAGGIDTVYGVPGEETTELMSALERSGIDFVLCRHEQAAAFMASVHGRLTGQPAVCLATLGPGATNLVTGVADATLDYAPLIAVTGQAGRERLGRESHQVIDLERLFDPVTNASKTILDGATIAGDVAEAIRCATAPRLGAVHLCLPEDVAAAEVAGSPLPVAASSRPAAPQTDIDEIAGRIRGAARPVLICGAEVVRSEAVEHLQRLLAETHLPTATSFMAKGVVDFDSPFLLGTFGLMGDGPLDAFLGKADLFVAVGFDPIEYPPGDLMGDTPVVVISETQMARGAGWRIAAEAVGDLSDSLDRLAAALEGFEAPREAAGVRPPAPDDDAELPDPDAALACLNAHIEPDDIVFSGVGNHKMHLARGFRPKRAGQFIIPNGLAGMGLALPGGIAAARLYHNRHVIAVCGDGDVLMNVQEMETATRLGIAMTVLVWIDGGYGLIEEKHRADTGEDQSLAFCDIDWAQLAGSFGWTHTAAETRDALAKALARGRTEAERLLITIPVTYDS